MGKVVILVDYSWVFYRSYFAFQNFFITLENDVKVSTGVLFGFTQLLESLHKGYPDAELIFCKDGVPKERSDLHSEYKANRKDKGCDIAVDSREVDSILGCFQGFKYAISAEKEADDVMAILAFEKLNEGAIVFIYSGDDDMLQLMPFGVKISRRFKEGRFVEVSENDVFMKYGVYSKNLLRYRSVIGDSSDNIKSAIPRFNRQFLRRFVEEWGKLGFQGALKFFEVTDVKYVDKLKESFSLIKRNLELMSLIKYRNEEYKFYPVIHNPLPDLNAVTKYKLYAYKRFLERG